MKFAKEYASQIVPEWQEAYMNYSYLKSLVKGILQFRRRNKPHPPPDAAHFRGGPALYRAFSGLTRSRHQQEPIGSADVENQAILVHPVREVGTTNESYQTTFLMAAEEGGFLELEFFRKVDDEFNKVEKFFRGKVGEVMKEASVLNKQMDALIAFRIKVENPDMLFNWSGEMTRLASDVTTSTAHLAASTPEGAKANRSRNTSKGSMDVIEEDGSSRGGSSTQGEQEGGSSRGRTDTQGEHSSEDDKDENENNRLMDKVEKPKNLRVARPPPIEVLDRVKINQRAETPVATIKGVLNVSKQNELKFSRENLNKVEQQLKKAFVEFYQKLRLLKSFGFLNTLAFSKLMKKYDKVTSRDTLKPYMTMVDNSYLGRSDEINKLMDRVESTFIKHFSNSNRRKGMAVLRPKPKIERHRITFSMGCLVGCTIALTFALILIVRARDLVHKSGSTDYMENIFPLYSLFGFVFLHLFMYAGNIYFWIRYRVNYTFIFGFKQGTELGYREVFLFSFGLAVLTIAAVLSNLDMEMDPHTQDYKAVTELLPLFLVLFVVIIVLCPFNIIYRSSRYFFLVCLFHCFCSGLYTVTLPDFFLADQLTSQVQAIRSLEFYICYYGWGDFKHRKNNCSTSDVFNAFSFIVACIPYWYRFLQCVRRLFEEKDTIQGYNSLKYFLTIVAVSMRTAYSINHDVNWRILAGIFSIIAAVISTYWDLVFDWGLLERNSNNRWLRDKLMIPHKSVYFGAMMLNVLLRFAWLQTVLDFHLPFMHRQTMLAVVASLEIIRRGIWNFFRLENEHLNNVGKYRAFKSVPLPFNYDETTTM